MLAAEVFKVALMVLKGKEVAEPGKVANMSVVVVVPVVHIQESVAAVVFYFASNPYSVSE